MWKRKLVYLVLSLSLIKNFVELSEPFLWIARFDDILNCIILILALVVMIFQKWTVKTILIYGFISGIAVYGAWKSGYSCIAFTILLFLVLREEDIDDVADYIWRVKAPLIGIHFVSILIASLLGEHIKMVIYYAERNRWRMSMGYSLPGLLATEIFDLMLLWGWRKRRSALKWQHYLGLVSVSLVLYLTTGTRTIFMVQVLFIVLIFDCSRRRVFEKIIKKCAEYIIPFMTAFMLISIKLYAEGCKIGILINSVLNNRIRLNGYKVYHYGMSLLGRKCPEGDVMDPIFETLCMGFDCVYTWLWVEMGFIWLILLTIIFYLVAKKHNYFVCIYLVSWGLVALTNDCVLRVVRFFPMIVALNLFGKIVQNFPQQSVDTDEVRTVQY